MTKKVCTVCGREIDIRGMTGHMRTHGADEHKKEDNGVIAYPDVLKTVKKPVKKQTKKPQAGLVKPVTKPVNEPVVKPVNEPVVEPVDKPKKKSWSGFFG